MNFCRLLLSIGRPRERLLRTPSEIDRALPTSLPSPTRRCRRNRNPHPGTPTLGVGRPQGTTVMNACTTSMTQHRCDYLTMWDHSLAHYDDVRLNVMTIVSWRVIHIHERCTVSPDFRCLKQSSGTPPPCHRQAHLPTRWPPFRHNLN